MKRLPTLEQAERLQSINESYEIGDKIDVDGQQLPIFAYMDWDEDEESLSCYIKIPENDVKKLGLNPTDDVPIFDWSIDMDIDELMSHDGDKELFELIKNDIIKENGRWNLDGAKYTKKEIEGFMRQYEV